MEDFKNTSTPVKRLEAVRLHFIEGYSYAQVGRELNVKGSTVAKWVKKWKLKTRFETELKELREFIDNDVECSFITRIEMNARLKAIEDRTRVIHFNFFDK